MSSSVKSQCSKIDSMDLTQEEKDDLLLAVNDIDMKCYKFKKDTKYEYNFIKDLAQFTFETFQWEAIQLLYEKLQKKFKKLKDWDSEYLHNKRLLNEQKFSNDKDLKDRVIKHIDLTQRFNTWKF